MDLSGFDGDVTLPAAHGGAPSAFTLSMTQRKKDVSRYGDTRFARNRGGILDVSGNVRVFLEDRAANTAPGATDLEPDGAELTLQASTGDTWVGDALFDFSVSHSFADPAIEADYPFTGTGDWSEVWDETA